MTRSKRQTPLLEGIRKGCFCLWNVRVLFPYDHDHKAEVKAPCEAQSTLQTRLRQDQLYYGIHF